MSTMKNIAQQLFHTFTQKEGAYMANVAQGSPTKEFFVGMLTRDIELSDSILDLLDNCLDGVVRLKKDVDKRNAPDYYKGFFLPLRLPRTPL